MAETRTWTHYEPTYYKLAARLLTLETVDNWLHDWSELEENA